MISQNGFEAFSIAALCEVLHCSQATVYRHVGGKAAILEGVVRQLSTRIVGEVRAAISDLEGTERVVTAIEVALQRIRAEPLGPVMMGQIRPDGDSGWLTASPVVSELAAEMIGRTDPLAAQWLLRATLALWYWPVRDRAAERDIVRTFIGPPFGAAE